MHVRERAFHPALAFALQKFRLLGDDFDEDQELLPQARIPDLVESGEKLPGFIAGVGLAFCGYPREQASEKFVDLFMRDHYKRLQLNTTRPTGLYNLTPAI
jgi:hypothetical protein